MSDTPDLFITVCTDIHRRTVIQNLRRVFSEVLSARDNVLHSLIRALDADNRSAYETILQNNGSIGYSADDQIRSILLKWCITGDCSSPR